MKIGLFFGSFNPIHTGHLIIANYIANYYVDKVWFIVSPQNPLKPSNDLLNPESRLTLAKLATEKDDRFQILDIEFRMSIPSYTIDTLKKISQQYVDYELFVIIGSDNYNEISKWKSSEEILQKYKILIYVRPGFPIKRDVTTSNNSLLSFFPLLDISSTQIRQLIAEGKSFRYLVPEKVYEEIKRNNYFK